MRHEPAIICQGCGFKNDTDSTSCYGCGLPLNDEVSLPAIEQGWPSGFRDRLDTNIIDFLLQLPILPLLGISMEGYFTTEEIFTPARFISIALLIALNVLYGTLLVGTFATTTGKLMHQTDVLRSDGSRVGYRRALIRELAKILSGIMLGFPPNYWKSCPAASHPKRLSQAAFDSLCTLTASHQKALIDNGIHP